MSSKNLDKLSTNELKSKLKSYGMSQTGDKGTLIFRCEIFEKCVKNSIAVDGKNPCTLKIGDLRKAASVVGVSPIGSQDEILTAFVEHMIHNKSSSGSQIDDNSTNQSGNSTENGPISSTSKTPDPIAVARRIIVLDENDDYEGILSLGGTERIASQTPIAVMRKAYLKLSLLIHPDKLSRSFDQATKAFQALVRAFERLSMPEVTEYETDDGISKKATGKTKKPLVIERSNEGCHRTRVCCPRCKQPWSEGGLDGNPSYVYNFLMLGLKQYTCSTCLFEFGCVTAIHKCPHCNKTFEYSPQDFHRKIVCGNSKCSKPFGFIMYHVSDRVMKELHKEIKEEQERRRKIRETKKRRAARRGRDDDDDIDEEKAYLLGLVDCCPRCGVFLEDYPDDEAQRRHLMECTDEKMHHQHAENKSKKREREARKAEKLEEQEAISSRAAWEFFGGKTTQLWMLEDSQLQKLAIESGHSGEGDKYDLIAAIADKKENLAMTSSSSNNNNTLMITGVTDIDELENEGNSRMKRRRRRTFTTESVPQNLQALSLDELLAVCASHGYRPQGKYKADVITEIEDELYAEPEDKKSEVIQLIDLK